MVPDQDTIISCTRCTTNVPLSQTTYDKSGKHLICFNCYNLIAKGIEPDKILQTSEDGDRVNYTCLSCGFKFTRVSTFQFGGRCFNCGKASVQKEATKQMMTKDRKSLLDY